MLPVLKRCTKDGLKRTPTIALVRDVIIANSSAGRFPAEVAVENGFYSEIREECLLAGVGFAGGEFPQKFNYREPWMNGAEVIISEVPNE